MIAACLATSIAVVVASQLHRVRGTTLWPAYIWAIAAAVGLAVAEAYVAIGGGDQRLLTSSLLRHAAACATLCPGMAVLGAKRPQDRGWQWVVVALWTVLLLPAGQVIAAGGAVLQLSGIWTAFLGMLIFTTGPLNYTCTRNCVPVWLFAGVQFLLLSPAMLATRDEMRLSADKIPGVGCGVALAALLLALAIWRVRTNASSSPCLDRWEGRLAAENLRWDSFRSAYGSFWELRIAQRVNQTADFANWPVRLTHHGFAAAADASAKIDAKPPTEVIGHVRQTLDGLLRRFERSHGGGQRRE